MKIIRWIEKLGLAALFLTSLYYVAVWVLEVLPPAIERIN